MKNWYSFSVALLVLLILCNEVTAEPTNPPIEIPRSGRFLAAEPQIEITPDGIVKVTVTTLKPCTGGRAYLGVIPYAAELEYPFCRIKGGFTLIDSLTASIKFNLKDLES